MDAHFTLAFTLPPGVLPLDKELYTLVGSFFNRHAVIPILTYMGLLLLVDIWFQVLFQRPNRTAFHLSLAVLVHYRSLEIFSLSS